MNRNLLVAAVMLLFGTAVFAQQKYELGKPNDDNYRYLDNYGPLKSYIDRDKYPNFKLGAGTTVNDYLNNSVTKGMINDNFDETVAGNAMKMASCVDYNTGNMNFSTVTRYVNTATAAGLQVYGHTLGWHSQQPKNWLLSLLADKPDMEIGEIFTAVASKDFCTDQTIVSSSDQERFGFTITFDAENGLKVNTTKSSPYQIQFVPMDNVKLEKGKTYKLTFNVKGSGSGKLKAGVEGVAKVDIPFNEEWKEVTVEITPAQETNSLTVQVVSYVGDVYIKEIKFQSFVIPTRPQTAKEMHDTLVYAMDKWIKGMMNACGGKVKAFDLINEALSGGGNDGQGNYTLQHSSAYNPNGNPDATWDVGGDAFYWQDYMGDLEYVRQACRLARKYGPSDVKLFINDYNLESEWDGNKKLKSLINWIKKWEADGVTKIDGIGTQMHISCFENSNHANNTKNAITNMFKLMAASGKLVRVSEMDMGYVRGSNRWASSVKADELTEAEHKKMADLYEWIIKQYLTIIPVDQQWGICQWCTNDSPKNSGWRADEPVGIWTLSGYRKHAYAGFVRGLNGGEPSAIDKIQTEKNIDTSKGIYTVTGVRYPAGTDLSTLPAGIYVVDGKKVSKTR